MHFDFAFEGDVIREEKEIDIRYQNITVLDHVYEIIQSHVDAAVYK